jgi:hypothetical protein
LTHVPLYTRDSKEWRELNLKFLRGKVAKERTFGLWPLVFIRFEFALKTEDQDQSAVAVIFASPLY